VAVAWPTIKCDNTMGGKSKRDAGQLAYLGSHLRDSFRKIAILQTVNKRIAFCHFIGKCAERKIFLNKI